MRRARWKRKNVWAVPLDTAVSNGTAKRGVPERDRWRSRLDPALGAGAVLLNLLVLSHANGNCGDGQKLKGPAAPVAAALCVLAEMPAGVQSKPVPGPAHPPEADLTAQVVCSEAEHTGPVVKVFRRPPRICPTPPKCGHALLLSYPVQRTRQKISGFGGTSNHPLPSVQRSPRGAKVDPKRTFRLDPARPAT